MIRPLAPFPSPPFNSLSTAGTKKVQQDIARPGVLERFTDTPEEARYGGKAPWLGRVCTAPPPPGSPLFPEGMAHSGSPFALHPFPALVTVTYLIPTLQGAPVQPTPQ